MFGRLRNARERTIKIVGVKTKKRVHIHTHWECYFYCSAYVCACILFWGWFLFVDCCGDGGRCCGGGFGPKIHAAQSSRGNTKNSAQNVKNK